MRLALQADDRNCSLMRSKSLMACSSWQNVFTTFCPVIISSMKPFTPASDSCCVRK